MSLLYDCSDAEDRADGLNAAEGAIRRGDLVVLPTDTVYGVAADAFSVAGVDALFRAKGRGRNMPSPVLVGSWAGLDGLVIVVDSVARELIEAFWPGGLSIIVEHAPSLDWDLGETRGTVMVRMPAHPAAIDLLTETGPLAVSSANRSGQPPPKTAAEAREQLGDEISVYLEAGPAEGTPSTIVDLTGDAPVLRRVGAVSADALMEIISDLVIPEELREAAGVKTTTATASPESESESESESAADSAVEDSVEDSAEVSAEDAVMVAAEEPAVESVEAVEPAESAEPAEAAEPVGAVEPAEAAEAAPDAPEQSPADVAQEPSKAPEQ